MVIFISQSEKKAVLTEECDEEHGCILPVDPIALAERPSVDRGKSG